MAISASEFEAQSDTDESDDQSRAELLRKQKLATRRQRKVQVVKNTGRSVEAAGVATQATGKTMKVTGKAVAATGRGLERGGASLTESGVALSATGAGAIIGVPLAAVGAVTTATGAVAQAGGTALTESGQAVDSAGRAIRKEGSQIVKQGDRLEQASDSLRSAKRQAIKNKLLSRLSDSDGSGSSLVSSAVSLGTDTLLRESWLALVPSWGLTLIWINIHIFLSFTIGSNYFSKLGQEWLGSGLTRLETKVASKAAGSGFSEYLLKSVSDRIGFLELTIVALLDIIVLVILLVISALLLALVDTIAHPIDTISSVVK